MELVDSDHDMARRDEEEDKIGNKYYTVRTQERVCIILEPGLSECVYNVHLHIEGKQLMACALHCTAPHRTKMMMMKMGGGGRGGGGRILESRLFYFIFIFGLPALAEN